MGERQSRYLEHPWREYAGPATKKCAYPGCGAAINQTIRLCEACKRKYNVWFSDDGYLRYAECISLDMGLRGPVPALNGKTIYA